LGPVQQVLTTLIQLFATCATAKSAVALSRPLVPFRDGRRALHTGAYWLLLKVRGNIPRLQPLATAEFKTLQMRLIKIAARISETATRVRIALAAACPEAELFGGLVRSFQPARP
jgi:hypothetical protein